MAPVSWKIVRSSSHFARVYSETKYSIGVDEISNIAIQILEQKALCQQDPDQDEDDEPLDDQAEYDSVLISSAGDLIAALANVLGYDFTRAFQMFFPLISKFYVSPCYVCQRACWLSPITQKKDRS